MASADEQAPPRLRHAEGRGQLPRAYGVTDYDALLGSRLRDADIARTQPLNRRPPRDIAAAAAQSVTHVLDTYTTRDGADIQEDELVGRASVAMGAVHLVLHSGNGDLLGRFLARAIRQADLRMARAAWCALVDSVDANDVGACVPWGDLRDAGPVPPPSRPGEHRPVWWDRGALAGDLCTVVSVEIGLCRPAYDDGEAAAIRNGACAGMLDLALRNRQWSKRSLHHACRLVLNHSADCGPVRASSPARFAVYHMLLDETLPPDVRTARVHPSRGGACSKHEPVLRKLLKALFDGAPDSPALFFLDDDRTFVDGMWQPPTGANFYQLPVWIHRGVHPELLAPLVEAEANRIALGGELADYGSVSAACPRVHVLCAHLLVNNAVERPESWQPKQQTAMAVRLLEALMFPNAIESVQKILIEPMRTVEHHPDDWARITREKLCMRQRHHHFRDSMSEARPTPYVPLLLGVPLLGLGHAAWGGHLCVPMCELLPRILSSFEWPAWTLIAALDELLLSRVKSERVQTAIKQLVTELGPRSPSRSPHAVDYRLPLWFLEARLGWPTVLTTALHNNEGGAFDLLMEKVNDWSGSALLEALTVTIAVDDVPHGLQLLEKLADEPLPRIVRPWSKGEFCEHGLTASSDETKLAPVGELPEGSVPEDGDETAASYHAADAALVPRHEQGAAGLARRRPPARRARRAAPRQLVGHAPSLPRRGLAHARRLSWAAAQDAAARQLAAAVCGVALARAVLRGAQPRAVLLVARRKGVCAARAARGGHCGARRPPAPAVLGGGRRRGPAARDRRDRRGHRQAAARAALADRAGLAPRRLQPVLFAAGSQPPAGAAGHALCARRLGV